MCVRAVLNFHIVNSFVAYVNPRFCAVQSVNDFDTYGWELLISHAH